MRITLLKVGLLAALSIAVLGTAPGSCATTSYPAAAGTIALQNAPSISCSRPDPCFQWKNLGSGIGIGASAVKNSGVQGTTFSNLNSSMTIGLITFGTTAGLTGYDNATVIPDLNQGVLGLSNNGIGVTGITKSNDPTGSAGVVGYDVSITNPNNVGVFGFSALDVGVFGSGHTTSGIGVFGSARDGGTGVFGHAKTSAGTGVVGTAPDGGVGIFGVSKTSAGTAVAGFEPDGGVGIFGVSQTSAGTAVAGFEPDGGVGVGGNSPNGGVGVAGNAGLATGTGVQGTANDGFGVFGYSNTRVGIIGSSTNSIGLAGENASSTIETFSVQNFGGGPLIRAFNSSNEVMSLDNAGNMVLAGSLVEHGTPMTASRTALGQRVIMYSPKQSVATVEDVGEGQLSGGQAVMRIDPAFAATMNPNTTYLVFITPQGDSNGLYVTGKTSSGFVVREHNGRSSIAFDYRIVAKPFASTEARLPMWISPQRSAPRAFAPFAGRSVMLRAVTSLRRLRMPHLPRNS